MPRLKDRNKQMPESFFYYEPTTKWRSTPWSSFSDVVSQVIQHRQGNPALSDRQKFPVDRATVENQVDEFCANVCAAMGWTNFIIGMGGTPVPKSNPPSQQEIKNLAAVAGVVKQLWAGIRTINDWLDAGAPAVKPEQAEARAAVCVACPKNGAGDLTKWFTKPASEAIRKQVGRLQAKKLSTALDDKLGICEACLCPMKLKVHIPMEIIKTHLNDKVIDELRKGKDCWQIAELAS